MHSEVLNLKYRFQFKNLTSQISWSNPLLMLGYLTIIGIWISIIVLIIETNFLYFWMIFVGFGFSIAIIETYLKKYPEYVEKKQQIPSEIVESYLKTRSFRAMLLILIVVTIITTILLIVELIK